MSKVLRADSPFSPGEEESSGSLGGGEGKKSGADLLVHYDSKHYGGLLFTVGFLLLSSGLVTAFKETPFIVRLERRVPESLLLIVVGLGFGAVTRVASFEAPELSSLQARNLLDYLVPPIMLSCTYELYQKHLVLCADGILLFGGVGTAMSIFATGFSLYAAYGRDSPRLLHLSPSNDSSSSFLLPFPRPLLPCLSLSCAASALDPVGVTVALADTDLSRPAFVMLFGEAIVSDAVAVVFFDLFEKLSGIASSHPASFYGFAAASPFVSLLGGFLVGVTHGAFCSVATRFATGRSLVLEPTIVVLSAYLSYVSAIILSWSGIASIVACGLVQRQYAFDNIRQKSKVAVKEGISTLSTVCGGIIFLLLGHNMFWLAWKVEWTLLTLVFVFSMLFRYVTVFVLGALLNRCRSVQLDWSNLFLAASASMRGAISYAIVQSVTNDTERELFETTTIMLIFLTSLVHGTAVKLFTHCFGTPGYTYSQDGKRCSCTRRGNFTDLVLDRVIFYCMAGMEDILGQGSVGRTRFHSRVEKLELFEEKYLRPILSNKPGDYNHFEKAIVEGAIHCEAHHRHSYDPKLRRHFERDEGAGCAKFAVLENDWQLDQTKQRLMKKRLERIKEMTKNMKRKTSLL